MAQESSIQKSSIQKSSIQKSSIQKAGGQESILIIGAGHAGVQMAASLRQEGFEGALSLISDEDALPYHKPPLSKAFLKSPEAESQVLRAEDFYEQNRIDRIIGKVVRLERARKQVVLEDGRALAYDRLVLATGARARQANVPGHDLKGVMALRSQGDALALRNRISHVQDVVVVGGGFIGMEAAFTLAGLGKRVTIVEFAPRILNRAVSQMVSDHMSALARDKGITILVETALEAICGVHGQVTHVRCRNGALIDAQMVVLGIGVVPNVELAQEAGLECANGIVVDLQMRSSDPAIWAIGDAVCYPHWLAERVVRLESVQNASDQAKLAARVMMGHDERFHCVPWFWSDQGDVKLQMAGLSFDADQFVRRGESGAAAFSVYHYRKGRLIAVDSVNRAAEHMLARRWLERGLSPEPALLADPASDLKAIG